MTTTEIAEYVPAGQMIPVADVRRALDDMHELVKDVLIEGVHYGVQSGTDMKALKKPGAEEIFKAFLCRPEFEDLPGTEVRPDAKYCAFRYRCKAVHWASGAVLAEGIGSCSSLEKKYHTRHAQPTCPDCGKATVIRGKFPDQQFGKNYWFCWGKKGGCNHKFALDAIQDAGDRETTLEEWADLINTIDKMAQKRAMVAAALTLGAVSAMFTQDIDEAWEENDDGPTEEAPAPEKPVSRRPASRPSPSAPEDGAPPPEDDEHAASASVAPQANGKRGPLTVDTLHVAMTAAGVTAFQLCDFLDCQPTQLVDAVKTWVKAEEGRTLKSCLEAAKTKADGETEPPADKMQFE